MIFVYDASWPLWGRLVVIAAATAVLIAMIWLYYKNFFKH